MAVVDEDFPAGVVHVSVVGFTEQDAVFYSGFAIIDSVSTVMRLTHSWRPIAARKNTSAISPDKCTANGQRDGSHGPSNVEGF